MGAQNVDQVLHEVLDKVGNVRIDGEWQSASSFAGNSEIRSAVIAGNPAIFDSSGRVFDDANWKELKLPSVNDMKKMLEEEENQ